MRLVWRISGGICTWKWAVFVADSDVEGIIIAKSIILATSYRLSLAQNCKERRRQVGSSEDSIA